MFALSLLGILVGAVGVIVVLTVLYWVIRYAVRDGVVDAQRRLETERVRGEIGLGPERSPHSRG